VVWGCEKGKNYRKKVTERLRKQGADEINCFIKMMARSGYLSQTTTTDGIRGGEDKNANFSSSGSCG